MNSKTDKKNKRKVTKSTSLAMESGNTWIRGILTSRLEDLSHNELKTFLDACTSTEDFKDNYKTVPNCIAKLNNTVEISHSERKIAIKELVDFLLVDYNTKHVNSLVNGSLGQMLFGYLFNGTELHGVLFHHTEERRDMFLALKDIKESNNYDKTSNKPNPGIKLDLGIDSKYKRKGKYSTPTEILEAGRNQTNKEIQFNLKIDKRMSEIDVLRTVEFGDKEISDNMIKSMEYLSTKMNGKSRVNIPYEYLSVVENNSKLDNVSLNEYMEILVVDSIRKGILVRDIINENREILEYNLAKNMLSIYTSLFQTVKLEYDSFTVTDLDSRHVLITLKRDSDSEFKLQFKFDLALNRVCM